MNQYVLKTLGCKANLYDSQLIEAELQKRGWTVDLTGKSAELCIVNSCTVTDEADRQSRKMASRLARENPEARVVVTGCAAEVDPERLTHSKGIHYVIGNQDKNRLVDLILEKLSGTRVLPEKGELLGDVLPYDELISRHPMDREWPEPGHAFQTPPVGFAGNSRKTRAFLKIQEGCNHFCTYCIIPYGRGPSRSLRPVEIIRQVKELVDQGIKEIIITGTNIGDYGLDWSEEPALSDLLRQILENTDLQRLRVSSLDPTEITPEILSLVKTNPRFCPHFHVSLQSGSDRVLKLMKRRYTTREIRSCLESLAELSTFVGMDVITGFPGETNEEFENTVALLSELPWTRLHVFPYSERNGTPASRLPGLVPPEVRSQRAQKLGSLSLERLKKHYRTRLDVIQSSDGYLNSVLMERPTIGVDGEKNWISGYSPDYLRVLVKLPQENPNRQNQILRVIPKELWIDSSAGEVSFLSQL